MNIEHIEGDCVLVEILKSCATFEFWYGSYKEIALMLATINIRTHAWLSLWLWLWLVYSSQKRASSNDWYWCSYWTTATRKKNREITREKHWPQMCTGADPWHGIFLNKWVIHVMCMNMQCVFTVLAHARPLLQAVNFYLLFHLFTGNIRSPYYGQRKYTYSSVATNCRVFK